MGSIKVQIEMPRKGEKRANVWMNVPNGRSEPIERVLDLARFFTKKTDESKLDQHCELDTIDEMMLESKKKAIWRFDGMK